MAKEPTAPPEGPATKPLPPPNVPSKQGVPPPLTDWVECSIDGRPGRLRATPPAPPISTAGMPPAVYTGHTSDPDFAPPNRVAGPDDIEFISEARTCDVHENCMTIMTGPASRTNDPGYEAPSRTVDGLPDYSTITAPFVPPDVPRGTRVDPFIGIPDAVVEGSDEPLDRPYAIIEDMGTLFRGLYEDGMGATGKLRSATLRYACRAIASVVGVVIFGLLIVGGVGVVLAVCLFRATDALELLYWRGRPKSRKTAQRMNHVRKKP